MESSIYFQDNILLSPLSTFAIGGRAKLYVKVESPEKLVEVIKWAKEKKQKFKVFAGGSNVVFPDEGLACLVIQVLGGKMEVQEQQIIADAGVLLMDMRVGGIQIADFHGNLFINTGGGIAKDVKELAEVLMGKVYKKFGITLEEEIRYF